MQSYHHQALEDLDIIWRIEKVPALRQFVHAIRDEDNRKLALDVISTFEREVMTRYHELVKGITLMACVVN